MVRSPQLVVASPLRRLAAFGMDWLIIAAYGLALFAVVLAINGGMPHVTAPYDTSANQLLGFISLTLPVIAYFIIGEHRGGTIGKRIMRLRVVLSNNQRPGLFRISARNIIKFLPWEIGHFSVHQFTAANLDGHSPSTMTFIVLAIVYLLVGLYLATMFWGKGHRTIYDLISGTQVAKS